MSGRDDNRSDAFALVADGSPNNWFEVQMGQLKRELCQYIEYSRVRPNTGEERDVRDVISPKIFYATAEDIVRGLHDQACVQGKDSAEANSFKFLHKALIKQGHKMRFKDSDAQDIQISVVENGDIVVSGLKDFYQSLPNANPAIRAATGSLVDILSARVDEERRANAVWLSPAQFGPRPKGEKVNDCGDVVRPSAIPDGQAVSYPDEEPRVIDGEDVGFPSRNLT